MAQKSFRILLLGEFSALHKNLREGLLQIADVQVDIASSGDGWKKISGVTIPFPQLRSMHPIDRTKYFLDEVSFINRIGTYDVIQLINPNILSLPLRRRLHKAVRRNAKCLSVLTCGDDYRITQAYLDGKFRYYVHDYDKTAVQYYTSKSWRARRTIKNELLLEKYTDVTIATGYEYLVGCSGKKNTYAIPLPINVDTIKYTENVVEDKIVFFHGLIREDAKGTKFIREAMERLKENYPNDVEIILDGHMPYDKYLQVLRKTNVLVDHCVGSSCGMNGCIAMAQGKVVLSGNSLEMRNTFGMDSCPVLHIEPDVNLIYSQMEWLVKNRDQIPEIGRQTRKFAEKYHDCKLVARQYLDAWKATGKLSDDTA